nr:iron ABC transporter [Alteromonas sp. K]
MKHYLPVFLAMLSALGLGIWGYLATHPIIHDAELLAVMMQSIWVPTALMAVLTGALFASSGLLIQTTLDNDFASPSTIGIASGALLGAVLVRMLLPDATLYAVWLGAFSGAAFLSMLVLLVSRLIGGGKLPVILIGMALGLGAGAIASIFLIYFENQTDGLFIWGSGQVLQTSTSALETTALPMLALLFGSLLIIPKLSLFVLGDAHAKSLGLAVNRWRWLILFLAIAQASLATALVGMIGFVGLMAPHLARYLVHYSKQRGSKQKDNSTRQQIASHTLFPHWLFTLVVGAMLVLFAEWCSRSLLFLGYRLPTGAFTALLGAPFFILLLLHRNGRALAATESQSIGIKPLLKARAGITLSVLFVLLVASVNYWLPASSTDEFFQGSHTWTQHRILLAGLAGFGLACAGTLLQTLFRNPMASPDISGVSATSVLVIACLLVLFPAANQFLLSLASLIGAGVVVFLLSKGLKHQLSVSQVALIGITITAFAGTATHILLTFGSSTASVTLMWLTGTTYAASMDQLVPLISVLIIAALAIVPFLRDLDILPLGETIPGVLGIPVIKRNRWLLGIAALITAICVASVGAISFVGLLAPHCARLLGLYRHQHLLPAAGMTGAILLIWADGLGRTLLAPNEIAAGLVVSMLGSLYFLLLLLIGYRKHNDRIA